jgi:hypothetical protein
MEDESDDAQTTFAKDARKAAITKAIAPRRNAHFAAFSVT